MKFNLYCCLDQWLCFIAHALEMHHGSHVHSPGQVDYFQLAVINQAQDCGEMFSSQLGRYLGAEWLGHAVGIYLTFYNTTIGLGAHICNCST